MSNQHFRKSSRRKNTAKQGTTARVLRILGKIAIAAVVAVMVPVVGLFLILGQIFNGPSVTARNVLTMSLLEPSGTKWIPPIFLSDEVLDEIKNGSSGSELPDIFNPGMIQINTGNSLSNSDEWKNHPDGVRIERISGSTFDAHIMIIRDPSKVYMATSTENFSKDIPGLRITEAIEREGAIAAINAGAFYDNGTSNPVVGSVPEGLVIAP